MSDPRAMPIASRQSQVPITVPRQGTPNARQILPDPAGKFVLDRFGWMTKTEQDEMLRNLLPTGLDTLVPPPRESVDGSAGYEAAAVQGDTFSVLNPFARALIVQRVLERGPELKPNLRALATDYAFASLREQMPAIGYALAHIYEGGFFGLLTARGARSAHAVQLGIIGEVLGFLPDPDLVYYTTDEVLSARLGGSTAQRKSTVLCNLCNGIQLDEQRQLAPMKLGQFDEVLFVDDEAKNQLEVMGIVIRGVCEGVHRAKGGMRVPDGEVGRRLDSMAEGLAVRAFEVSGVDALHSDPFWGYVVGQILAQADDQELSEGSTSGDLIQEMRRRKEWVPDILRIIDPARIDPQQSERRLRQAFEDGQLTCGTKRSLLMLDIDGTLLRVDARVYIRSKSHPERILGMIDQASFAQHPAGSEAIARVAQKNGLPEDDMELCFMDFRDEDRIKDSLLRALITGELTRRN